MSWLPWPPTCPEASPSHGPAEQLGARPGPDTPRPASAFPSWGFLSSARAPFGERVALSAGYAQKPPLLPGPRCPDRSSRLLGRLVASATAPYLALHGHPWDTPRRPFSRRKENPSPLGVREPAARPAASPLPSAHSVPGARPPAAPQPPPALPAPSLRPGCPLRPDHPPRRLPRVLQRPLPRLAAAARLGSPEPRSLSSVPST